MVRSGYKETEAGIIPEDWDARLIGDSFEFKNGLNKAKAYFGHGTPIINYMDVFGNSGLQASDIVGLVSVTKEEQSAYSARKGDLFFTRTSETVDEIGMSSVLLDDLPDAVFSGFVLRGRDKPSASALNVDFKKYCFHSSVVRKQIRSTASYTTRALTNGKLLSKVFVPTPSDPKEQKAIAEALSDVDGLIAGLEALIAKKHDLKTATMQQLLTGKTRLPGFGDGIGMKQTELGEIPEDWDVLKLGDIASVGSGGTPNRGNPAFWNGKIPWITTAQIDGTEIFDTEEKITELGLSSSAAKVYPKGTLLMAMYGQGKTRGKVGIMGIDASINQACAAIRVDSKVQSSYVLHSLNSSYEEIRELSNSGGQENLSSGIVKSLQIVLPSENTEQLEIAELLSDLDRSISALERRHSKARAIKQGMMQELLTGRTRLI